MLLSWSSRLGTALFGGCDAENEEPLVRLGVCFRAIWNNVEERLKHEKRGYSSRPSLRS